MHIPSVIMRGGGDLSTGIAHRLYICGFRPVILELPQPRMIRRTVCFAEAVYSNEYEVEGIKSKLSTHPLPASINYIPVIIDQEGMLIKELKPDIIIDARMQKKKMDTKKSDAMLVIGIGPGFRAGGEVHLVIETQRGHALGRVYREGEAIPDTGIPGEIMGETITRLLRAPDDGIFETQKKIGDIVERGEIVAKIGKHDVKAEIDGLIRGLMKEGIVVKRGEKIGDIDPRKNTEIWQISDKSRAIGGSVLEAIFSSISWNSVTRRAI